MKNALIIAKSGAVQEGLQALLAAQPTINIVAVARNLAAALDFVAEYCPAIILLVPDFINEEQRFMLARIRQRCPQSYILMLVDDEEMARLARSYPVDNIFNHGARADKLSHSIEQLLEV